MEGGPHATLSRQLSYVQEGNLKAQLVQLLDLEMAAPKFAADAGRSSSEYTIVSSTVGIISIGTPHRGS